MQIQQRRHSLRSPKQPVSTDYAEPAPDYVNDLPNRQPVQARNLRDEVPEKVAITSTRTAFARYALFRNSWSEALRQQVLPLQVPGKGWQRGLNLNNSVNAVVDADTNAIVLESLSLHRAWSDALSGLPLHFLSRSNAMKPRSPILSTCSRE